MPGAKKSEGERSRELLAAARDLALQEGLGAVTGRRVAEAAGLSAGLVFFHFGDKEGLLAALADFVLDEGAADIAAAPIATDPVQLVLSVLDARQNKPRLIELLIELWVDARDHPKLKARLTRGASRYRELLAAKLDARDDRDDLARVALTLLLGAAVQSTVLSTRDRTATREALRATSRSWPEAQASSSAARSSLGGSHA